MGLLDDDFDIDPCVDVSVTPKGKVYEVMTMPIAQTPYVDSDGAEYEYRGFPAGYTSRNMDIVAGVIRYKLRRIPLSKLSSSIEQVCRKSIDRSVRNLFKVTEVSSTEWHFIGMVTKYSRPCGFVIKIME